MRLYELTIKVWGPDDYIPKTFREWVDLAFGTEGMDLGASPTTLENVSELRYPLANDIIARRGRPYTRGIY